MRESSDGTSDDLIDDFKEKLHQKFMDFNTNFKVINYITFGFLGMLVFSTLIEYDIIDPFPFVIEISIVSGYFCFHVLYVRYFDYFGRFLLKKLYIDTRFRTHFFSMLGQSIFLVCVTIILLISLYVFFVGSSVSLGLNISHDLSNFHPIFVIIFFIIGVSFVTLIVQGILKFIDHRLSFDEINQSKLETFVDANYELLTESKHSSFQLYQSLLDEEE